MWFFEQTIYAFDVNIVTKKIEQTHVFIKVMKIFMVSAKSLNTYFVIWLFAYKFQIMDIPKLQNVNFYFTVLLRK